MTTYEYSRLLVLINDIRLILATCDKTQQDILLKDLRLILDTYEERSALDDFQDCGRAE